MHVRGRETIGIYPLLRDDTCALLACDFDKGTWALDALAYLDGCHANAVPAALERSRSGDEDADGSPKSSAWRTVALGDLDPGRNVVLGDAHGLAGATGVSRALIYRYYGDTTLLYREVVATVLREWNDALVAVATDPVPTWPETLGRVVRTCVVWAAERDVLWGLLVRDADVTQRLAGRTMEEGRALLPALIASVLTQGVELGVVRRDLAVDDMAFVIAEVTIAGSFQAMASTRPAARDRRLHTIVESLLHGVLLPEEQ